MAIYAAPTVGRLGVLTKSATFNQACTGMVARAEVGTWFLYWTLYFGRDWFNSRANGAAQQNISKAIVAGYRIIQPAQPLLAAFDRVASSLHERIRSNPEQAQTLAKVRDKLLPRLVSGQLRLGKRSANSLPCYSATIGRVNFNFAIYAANGLPPHSGQRRAPAD